LDARGGQGALMSPKPRSALALLIGIVWTGVICEVSLQLLTRLVPDVGAFLSRTTAYEGEREMMQPDARLGWRPSPAFVEHDRNGFRNPRVPPQAAVVVLGDSQAYGLDAARTQTWPQQLERLGRLTTYNMGVPGYGPLQSLLLMEEALALKPRVIIESCYVGNDFYDAYLFVYTDDQGRQWRTTDAALVSAMRATEEAEPLTQRTGESFRLMTAGAQPSPSVGGRVRAWLSRHSKLYGFLRVLRRAYRLHIVAGDAERYGPLKPEYCQVYDDGQRRTIFAPAWRLVGLNLDDPRIAEGLRITCEVFRQMRDRARAAGAEFYVLLLPTKEAVFNVAPDAAPAGFSPLYAVVVQHEARLWQRLKAFCEQEGIPVIDALPALRAALHDGPQPYPTLWNGHPNAAGYRVIAQTVLTELRRRGW